MSRVRNATEFRLKFREISARYENIFGRRLAEAKARLESEDPTGQAIEGAAEQLEAHVRIYLVNSLLAALNWRMDVSPEDGMPNLYVEISLQSLREGTRRFLDYLGVEREASAPLVVVETKRPSSELPRLAKPGKRMPATYSEIIARGLGGESLIGDWTAWMAGLRDYARSVRARSGSVPSRVVQTNGDWIVLFLDPEDAFVSELVPDPNKILVFADRAELDRRSNELFTNLDYFSLAPAVPPLHVAEVRAHVEPAGVTHLVHGIRLLYVEQPTIYSEPSPIVTVAPLVLLRSRTGASVRVEAGDSEFRLPDRLDDIPGHIQSVSGAALRLAAETETALGRELPRVSVTDYYRDGEWFAAQPGVRRIGQNQYVVVTGSEFHFLQVEPIVRDCPHHDWTASKAIGAAATGSPILARSVRPRSFFVSSEPYHCAHRAVMAAKASPITQTNQERCGPRSGGQGDAFCEVFEFETCLCCRACVFESICTAARVFALPC